ncbi:MAG: hypothetical protein KDA79_04180 [Planctomycetaceae bacterium]|nr:hypothetical protein [Planctomycetaceae bacterium]
MATAQTSPMKATGNRSSNSMSPSAEQLKPADDFVDYLKTYAREKPDVAALWCFGIGFVLGWKLIPW